MKVYEEITEYEEHICNCGHSIEYHSAIEDYGMGHCNYKFCNCNDYNN